jgi:hypothetical protein
VPVTKPISLNLIETAFADSSPFPMVITKTHNVNANNALELWHEAPYSINHKVMTVQL